MLRRRLVEAQPQDATEREGIGGPPRDAALRIDPLDIPDHQQAEVRARGQTRASQLRGVERRALRFDERVDPMLVEYLIQPLVERLPARDGQLVRRNPQPRRACPVRASAQGHAGVEYR